MQSGPLESLVCTGKALHCHSSNQLRYLHLFIYLFWSTENNLLYSILGEGGGLLKFAVGETQTMPKSMVDWFVNQIYLCCGH